jgi:DNA-binding LytR/AlgR family response regulator
MHVILPIKRKLIKVNTEDVNIIQSMDDYIKIYLHNGQSLIVRMTMRQVHELIGNKEFIRIHRSYIIPLNAIEMLDSSSVVVNGKEYPVGRVFKKDVYRAFKDFNRIQLH